MDRLRKFWPALIAGELATEVTAVEAALAGGSTAALRRAAARLRCTDAPGHLAEIAEEGLADEFAEFIPGAVVDAGMLVLSTEHAALIDRGRTTLARVEAALRTRQ